MNIFQLLTNIILYAVCICPCTPLRMNTFLVSSVQSSSVQSSSVQSSSVQSSPVQFSPVHFSPFQFSSVQPSSVQSSPVQFSPAQFSSVHFSPAQSCSVHLSPVQFSPLLHKFLPVSSEPSTEVTDRYATLRTPARVFRVSTFPPQKYAIPILLSNHLAFHA